MYILFWLMYWKTIIFLFHILLVFFLPPSFFKVRKGNNSQWQLFLYCFLSLPVCFLPFHPSQTKARNFCFKSRRTYLLPNPLYIHKMPGCQMTPAIPLYFLLICEVQGTLLCVFEEWIKSEAYQHFCPNCRDTFLEQCEGI